MQQLESRFNICAFGSDLLQPVAFKHIKKIWEDVLNDLNYIPSESTVTSNSTGASVKAGDGISMEVKIILIETHNIK